MMDSAEAYVAWQQEDENEQLILNGATTAYKPICFCLNIYICFHIYLYISLYLNLYLSIYLCNMAIQELTIHTLFS